MPIVGILAAASYLAACTSPAGPAVDLTWKQNPDNGFEGLLPSADSAPKRPGVRRYILQIHGMDTPDENYGEQLLGLISQQGYLRTTVSVGPTGPWIPARLAKTKLVTGEALTCAGSPNCVFPTFGKYRVDRFKSPRTGDDITVYTYFWRGDLWRIEGNYAERDLNPAAPIAAARSPVNNALKYSVMDNGLVDAAAYLGPMGQLVREGVETTLCAMVADAVGTDAAKGVAPGGGCLVRISQAVGGAYPQDVEFDFLSYSLGSRMLFDVLNPPSELQTTQQLEAAAAVPGVVPGAAIADPMTSRRFLATRVRTFFMAANQLPLLAIGRVSVADAEPVGEPHGAAAQAALGARPATFLDLRGGAAEARVAELTPAAEPLEIVGFQDPDDLLGFRAGDAIGSAGSPQVIVRDVMHRNTPQWLWLFSWPPDAHARELYEPTSTKLILCGGQTDASGHLHPYDCGPAR